MLFRRYEVLLPLRFNDGTPVPPELFVQTNTELAVRFGGVTSYPQPARGIWIHEGVVYEEDVVKLSVDVPDTNASREFFLCYKATLKERCRQIEIWIASYQVEVD